MKKGGGDSRTYSAKTIKSLHAFSLLKTPRQVEKELLIGKIKTKPFLENNLLQLLNPSAKKGRIYTLTNKARMLLGLPVSKRINEIDWNLIGWVIASPKQRLVVMKTLAIDSVKRASEEIRERASNLNPHLTRISTKDILNELIKKGLVKTELSSGRRYYWISEKGLGMMKYLSQSNGR